MRGIAIGVLLAAGCALAADAIAPFSAMGPGARLPAGWRLVTLPRVPAARISLASDGGATVLHVQSEAAAGTAAHALTLDARAQPWLAWRWKVDRVVEHADLARREGDDFAARVYVFFDVPASELPWAERAKVALARLVHGAEVPAAGLCYVWDNRHAVGTIAPNPYAPHIRTFVLESGAAQAGRWVAERRDLDADFRAAFPGRPGPVPRITGIAAGNDTDQTGESASAWFGDFRVEAGP
ncbi:MAG TPA: DUF3047 domain-containing protein [Usitatibacter sp.]|nr:DUF3047 domain-containing protein [Usitatibacter sp.]